jgi:hypothetical protein
LSWPPPGSATLPQFANAEAINSNSPEVPSSDASVRLLVAEGEDGGFATTVAVAQTGGTTVQIGTAGGLVFNITYGSSVNNAPAGFTDAFANAIQFYEAQFTDPVTINIEVGWGEIDGQALTSAAVGESETFLDKYSYAQFRSALMADAKSADDATAISFLSANDPTGGGNYLIATAEEKALGLIGDDGSLDGYIGFGSGVSYSFDSNNRAVSGKYDFIGVAEHEITEIMGRIALLGQSLGSISRTYSALDLFRYSAAGTRQLVAGRTAYFSFDGGNTNLNNFNRTSGGDYGDWASSAGNDSYNAFGSTGVVNVVSSSDLREVDVLGWDRATATATASTPAPTPTPTTTPTTTPTSTPTPQPAPQSLQFVGTGDFEANGRGDVAFGISGGQIALWLNQNGALSQSTVANASMGAAWSVAKTGDFNGDAATDLLWSNNSGQVAIWGLNGATLAAFGIPAGQMGAEWHVAGVGDLNGDGNADIFWTSTAGNATVWSMNGTALAGLGQVNGQMGAEWSVVATGDFDGNAKADVLWRSNSGDETVWGMNGANLASLYGAVGHMGAEWHVAGVGNFNGDATQDIVWVSTGNNVQIWDMASGRIGQIVTPAGHDGLEWHLDGVGNFTGGGAKNDLLWLTSAGAAQVWHVTGTQVTVSQQTTPSSVVLLGL